MTALTTTWTHWNKLDPSLRERLRQTDEWQDLWGTDLYVRINKGRYEVLDMAGEERVIRSHSPSD